MEKLFIMYIKKYLMYNVIENNYYDYDSYPTLEEYKKWWIKLQINYAYEDGRDTTGIPMRSQMPIYNNDNLNIKWIMVYE